MPSVRAGFATRFVALILAVLLASASELCAQQAGAPAAGESKPGAAPDRSGTKKTRPAPRPKSPRDRPGFYMGRPIADVMSWQGADWLFRETRIDEEQPEAMLDALKIPPGATVADVGAGAGYHSVWVKGPGPLGFQRFCSRADRVSIAAPAHDTPCVLNHASSRFQPSAA
jgi:hypothetical protein